MSMSKPILPASLALLAAVSLIGCNEKAGSQVAAARRPVATAPALVSYNEIPIKPAAATVGPPPHSLVVGDNAPALKVADWEKGGPITMEKGKVYVIEFWATWCGPCKQTIPHLTEFAKQFAGKATFVGVSILEDQNPPAQGETIPGRVAAFVKNEGDEMNYHVARETDDQYMRKGWLEAAGQSGIPCAFIVDQNDKIAWFGHPLDNMDKVLQQVIDGKYDEQLAAQKSRHDKMLQDDFAAAMQKATVAENSHDYKTVVSILNDAIKLHPEFAGQMNLHLYDALLATDPKKGVEFAKQLASSPEATADSDLQICAIALRPDFAKLKIDFKQLKPIAQAIHDNTPDGSKQKILSTAFMAAMAYRMGDKKTAIAEQKDAVQQAQAEGANVPPAALQELQSSLMTYEGK